MISNKLPAALWYNCIVSRKISKAQRRVLVELQFMEYPKPGEELIDDIGPELQISQEKAGALVPSSPQSA